MACRRAPGGGCGCSVLGLGQPECASSVLPPLRPLKVFRSSGVGLSRNCTRSSHGRSRCCLRSSVIERASACNLASRSLSMFCCLVILSGPLALRGWSARLCRFSGVDVDVFCPCSHCSKRLRLSAREGLLTTAFGWRTNWVEPLPRLIGLWSVVSLKALMQLLIELVFRLAVVPSRCLERRCIVFIRLSIVFCSTRSRRLAC